MSHIPAQLTIQLVRSSTLSVSQIHTPLPPPTLCHLPTILILGPASFMSSSESFEKSFKTI